MNKKISLFLVIVLVLQCINVNLTKPLKVDGATNQFTLGPIPTPNVGIVATAPTTAVVDTSDAFVTAYLNTSINKIVLSKDITFTTAQVTSLSGKQLNRSLCIDGGNNTMYFGAFGDKQVFIVANVTQKSLFQIQNIKIQKTGSNALGILISSKTTGTSTANWDFILDNFTMNTGDRFARILLINNGNVFLRNNISCTMSQDDFCQGMKDVIFETNSNVFLQANPSDVAAIFYDSISPIDSSVYFSPGSKCELIGSTRWSVFVGFQNIYAYNGSIVKMNKLGKYTSGSINFGTLTAETLTSQNILIDTGANFSVLNDMGPAYYDFDATVSILSNPGAIVNLIGTYNYSNQGGAIVFGDKDSKLILNSPDDYTLANNYNSAPALYCPGTAGAAFQILDSNVGVWNRNTSLSSSPTSPSPFDNVTLMTGYTTLQTGSSPILSTMGGGWSTSKYAKIAYAGVPTIDVTNKTVEVNHTVNTDAVISPSNSTVTYKSLDRSIATVDENGVITGVSAGTVEINITAVSTENITKSVSINVAVTNDQPLINVPTFTDIPVGGTFDPLENVTASDLEDGDLTSKIIATGLVRTNVAGVYTVTYSVTDSNNNVTTVKRIVLVNDANFEVGNNYIISAEDFTRQVDEVNTSPDAIKTAANVKAYDKTTGLALPSSSITIANLGGYSATFGTYPIQFSVTGEPSLLITITANVLTDFTIKENYVDRKGRYIKASTTTTMTHLTDYTKVEPLITSYVYLGYKIDGGDMLTGQASLSQVAADHTIEFVYGQDNNLDLLEDFYTISENYVNHKGDTISSATTTDITALQDYTKAPQSIPNYVYIGYQLNNGALITDVPFIEDVVSTNTITLLYGVDNNNDGIEDTFTINESYLDRAGNVIQSNTSTTVASLKNYSKGADTIINYVYVGYRIDGGELTSGKPSITEVTEDHNVAFVYGVDKNNSGAEDTPIISENYSDNKGNILLPTSQTIVKALEDYTKNAPDIENYVYLGYIINEEPLVEGMPSLSQVTQNTIITFMYKLDKEDTFSITEDYVDRIGNIISAETVTEVPPMSTYTKTLPSIPNYVYVGYYLNYGSLVLGVPNIEDISQDNSIEFLYGVDKNNDGIEDMAKVNETYINRAGVEIKPAVATKLAMLTNYKTEPPSILNYVFVGYHLDGDTLIIGTPFIDEIADDHDIQFVYGKDNNLDGVEDIELPDSPVINPISEGDKTASGTGEAGSKIVITLPDNTTIETTVPSDGNWTIDLPELSAGDKLTVTQKDVNNNESLPTEIVIAQAPPDPPVVNPISDRDKTASGTGEPGAKIVITLPDNTTIETTVQADGSWTIDLPKLSAGDKLTIIQKDENNNPSLATEIVVAKAPPNPPVVNPISEGDKTASGTGEAGSKIVITLPDNTTIETTVPSDGNWTIDLPEIPAGNTIQVSQEDEEGNSSLSVAVTIVDTTPPLTPTINEVIAGDKAITGLGEANATVIVTLPDGITNVETTVNSDGIWEVQIPNDNIIGASDKITVIQKDPSGNVSERAEIIVESGFNGVAPVAPSVDEFKKDDLAITGFGEPGAAIIVTLPDGSELTPVTVDEDGTWAVTIPVGLYLEVDEQLTISQTNAYGKSPETIITVSGSSNYTTPNPVVVNQPIQSGATQISGKGEVGSVITLTLPDGSTVDSTIDSEGFWSVSVSDLNVGDTISVIQTNPNNMASEPVVISVVDTISPSSPTVSPINTGDTVITGKGEPGAEVIVTLPNGNILKGVVDDTGNWTLDIPTLNAGDVVSAVLKDENGNISNKVDITVKDITPPESPLVDTLKAGDASITGSGEPGAKIMVTLPDKSIIETVVDINGKWKVDNVSFKAGDLIRLRQKDPSGNMSPSVQVTVLERNNIGNTSKGSNGSNGNYISDQVKTNDTSRSNNDKNTIDDKTSLPQAIDKNKVMPKLNKGDIPYIYGYGNGIYRPEGKITRAEVSQIFFTLLLDETKYTKRPSAFKDIEDGIWYTQAINYIASLGIVSGYGDGYFRPNNEISRAEFAQIAFFFADLELSDNYFIDVPDNYWAKTAIYSDHKKGWLYGYTDKTFRPDNHITRAEAIVIINRMLERNEVINGAENNTPTENLFGDINSSYWAYNDFIEATSINKENKKK